MRSGLAEHPIARRTAARAARSGVLFGLGFGLFVVIEALGYRTAYPTAAARDALARIFGTNVAIEAIAGPARRLDTVGGFTAWKCLVTLSVVGALWGLLTSTKLMRGEEDLGRTELLASGATDRRGATRQALAGLAAGAVGMLCGTGVVILAACRDHSLRIGAGPALWFTMAIVESAVVFLAIGAVTSQLAGNRREAAGMAGALLGASFLLRMAGDSGLGFSFLDWATPLGWAEESHPLTSTQPLALLPAVATVALGAAAAIWLAGRRDLGSGIVGARDRGPERPRLLSSPIRLAVRTTGVLAGGFVAGCVGWGFFMGLIGRQGGAALTSSKTVERLLARLGFAGASTKAYLAFCEIFIALLATLLVAALVNSIVEEESSGRLSTLLAAPVARRSWFAGRAVAAAAVVGLVGLASGVFVFAGTVAGGGGVSFASSIEGGLSIVPQAWCVLGIGLCLVGLMPRAATVGTYALVTWSFVVGVIGTGLSLNHLLLDTSLVHQMGTVPLAPIDWTSAGVVVACGAAAALLGSAGIARRDILGD